MILPPSLEELIEQEHPVRIVNQVIEQINIDALIKNYKGGGTSSYHPRMLLKVLVYAYLRNVSEDALSRILSYLKYLGVVEELRERGSKDAVKESNQKFIVLKTSPKVRELMYELKANRTEKAKEHWAELIATHALFATIRNDFFGNDDIKTFIDLEHFLKDADEASQTPLYYQNGGKFLIALFEDLSFVKVNGNSIELIKNDKFEFQNNNDAGTELSLFSDKNEKEPESEPFHPVVMLPGRVNYSFTLRGDNINTTINISKIRDFNLAKTILENIESELHD
jgi:hypothetical protein